MARRGRGEGTIRRRSDGRWEATITLGDRRKSLYGKTRGEVLEKLRAAQRDYEQHQFVADHRQTVEQYLASWLESRRSSLKEKTLRGYESVVRVHIVPVIGGVKLSQLTAQHVQRVITACQEKGLKSRSVSEAYGTLHRALRAAERLGIVAQAVTARVQRPRIKTREMRPLSRDEAQAFLEAAHGHWLESLFRLALSTGMRRGEILGLRWRDVDLVGSRLSVVNSMDWYGGAPVYTSPKTKRSRRQIALSQEMVATLIEHRRQQRAQRLRAGPAWQGEQYDAVFCDELGLPLREYRLRRSLKRVLAAADLPLSVRFHDLRHTCATLLLQQRVHPKVVSELLGHSTVTMTLDRYSHVLPDMQEEAARAMAAALGW